jgi:diguanylate cyclase (GGDEF)-like protein
LEDNLTGVRNQRAFEEDLSRELARSDRSGQPLALVLLDLNELKRVNDTLGHQAGDERLQLLAATMTEIARDADSAYRIGGDEFALIATDTRAWGALRLVQRLQEALSARVDQPRVVTAGIAEAGPGIDRDALIRNADLALIEAKSAQRDALIYSRELRQTPLAPAAEDQAHHLKTLATALARAVDAKDSQTRSHCETVAETCALIGAQLGLDAARIAKLRLAGLLHDVGKIGVDDAILNKPGPLTDQEYEAMKTHSAVGYGIVCATELDDEAEWILRHHERIDAKGYPEGLSGEEIPLESRIIFVADAFEAMTADRPYRRAMPEDQALAEMDRNAGSQFDLSCVAALRRVLGKTATTVPGSAG